MCLCVDRGRKEQLEREGRKERERKDEAANSVKISDLWVGVVALLVSHN